MSESKIDLKEFERIFKQRKMPPTLPTKEALKRIWAHEKKVRGIDWLAAEKGGPKALRTAVAKAQSWLDEQARKLSTEEIETAKSMGVLNAEHRVPDISRAFFDTMADGTPEPVPFPDDAPSFVVWGWNEQTVANYQAARGDDVEKEITNLIANFQVLEQSDDVGIAVACVGMGIFGFAAAGIQAALGILGAVAQINAAVSAYAVLQGLTVVGVNLVVLSIAIVVIAVLIPLIIFMLKDAMGLFVIVNNTTSDLIMDGITFTSGKCISGFKRDAAADDPKAIIPQVFEIYNPELDETIKSISAGFFGVRKRDNALVGTQGALSFAATDEYPDGVYLGWEVPLSQGSNRQLVSATYTGTLSDFSDRAYDSGVLNTSDTSTEGNTVEAHMNSGSGSHAYSFVFVD